jgi:hypothetical protein
MALFGGRAVTATVVTVAWSRVISLESQRWVPKRSPRPPDSPNARNVQKHAGHRYQQVTDGAPRSVGITLPGTDNGSFRTDIRSEVYYTYEVLEWGQGRSLTASGDDPSAVRWPDDPLGAGERVKSRHEEYSATFEAAGKRYETSLPEQEWRSLERGSSCTLSLGLMGGVKRVHPGG